MGVEIERKFRVRAGWRPDSAGEEIAQGYLSSVPERTVRDRLPRGRRKHTLPPPHPPPAPPPPPPHPNPTDEGTGDARYYTSRLARTPYRLWEER